MFSDSGNDDDIVISQLVKHTHCPTILTRTGDRIRSNGKAVSAFLVFVLLGNYLTISSLNKVPAILESIGLLHLVSYSSH